MDDCANSHMEVENTLIRLREATAEINRATDDTRMRLILEKTWILQDRLVFANQVRQSVFVVDANEFCIAFGRLC